MKSVKFKFSTAGLGKKRVLWQLPLDVDPRDGRSVVQVSALSVDFDWQSRGDDYLNPGVIAWRVTAKKPLLVGEDGEGWVYPGVSGDVEEVLRDELFIANVGFNPGDDVTNPGTGSGVIVPNKVISEVDEVKSSLSFDVFIQMSVTNLDSIGLMGVFEVFYDVKKLTEMDYLRLQNQTGRYDVVGLREPIIVHTPSL